MYMYMVIRVCNLFYTILKKVYYNINLKKKQQNGKLNDARDKHRGT